MGFFEWGLSELANVPHHRTWLMVHDAGALGLRAIYERAGLPPRLLPAFRAAVDTYHVLQLEGDEKGVGSFQERMLQRFLTQPHTAAREDLDYLMDRLDLLSSRSRSEGREAVVKGAA
jgi:uncharacterized protein (DUF2336 family)